MSPEEVREAIESREAVETAGALGDLLEEAGGETDAEALEQVIRDAERWRESLDGAGDGVELAEQLDRALDRVERLEAQARARGGGTDHPSCWYDEDGSVGYLFDVALLARGFVVDLFDTSEHRLERDLLPLEAVRTGSLLTEAEFLSQTRAVYQWSVKRGGVPRILAA